METLVDGNKYWLGACFGVYDKKNDIFILGNCWVHRSETIYKNDYKMVNS